MEKKFYQELYMSIILVEREEIIFTSSSDTDVPFGDKEIDSFGLIS